MNKEPLAAFTVIYPKIVKVLHTKCGVSEAFNPELEKNKKPPTIFSSKTIWDTGATASVISNDVVAKLGLKPISKAKVFHVDGESIVNVYSINIILSNNVIFPYLRVTEGKLNDADILIGMDIIAQGDFVITAAHGKTKFSFQVPSTHDTDYNEEMKLLNNI